jgi:TM2 domain-containing membrane protein YozV
MTDQPSPPAGWYPHDGGQRYWDGQAWTEHTAPAQVPPPPVHIGYGTSPWPTQPAGMVPYAQVAPKSPGIALLASFFVPGLGSMINGEVAKGVGILVGYCISLVLLLVIVGVVGVIGFWIWGMVDGYTGAQKWNAQHGILS